MKKLKRTGNFDFWSREILTDQNGIEYLDVDGIPHTKTENFGEPDSPLKSYKFVS